MDWEKKPEVVRLRLAAYVDIRNYGCPEGCAFDELLHALTIKKDCVLHKNLLER